MGINFRHFVRANGGLILLFGVLTCSLSANVLMFYDRKHPVRPAHVEAGVRTGTFIHPFTVIGKDGKKAELEFPDSQTTVLYVLSPTCGWCRRNQANIIALASQQNGKYRFVGLSTTSDHLQEYWATTTLPFPVYSVVSPQVLSVYHLSDETPQMAVVANGGQIVQVWHGALMGDNLTGAERYFGIKLPGLLTVAAVPTASGVKPDLQK
jgi:hypothetical protein